MAELDRTESCEELSIGFVIDMMCCEHPIKMSMPRCVNIMATQEGWLLTIASKKTAMSEIQGMCIKMHLVTLRYDDCDTGIGIYFVSLVKALTV